MLDYKRQLNYKQNGCNAVHFVNPHIVDSQAVCNTPSFMS